MTVVHQAFRFELDPSDRARSALASHCGAAAFAYNWGLGLVAGRLEAARVLAVLALRQGASAADGEAWAREMVGPAPWSLPALRREWNRSKAEVAPWWAENSKEAYNSGLDALARALGNFFDSRTGRRRGATVGFPRRKKRGRSRRSCRFTTGALGVVDRRHIRLPRIGVVRTKEPADALLRRLGEGTVRVLSATVSEDAGRWCVSFGCEVQRQDRRARRPGSVVGVDLGVRWLATLSTGEHVPNPKPLDRYARRIARLSRQRARQQAGSGRSRRTRARLARCHRRAANLRRDSVHKLTSRLAATYGTVVVEDLNVRGMTAAPKPRPDGRGGHGVNGRAAKAGLNRAVLDAAPAEVRRQLTYKMAWRRGTLVVAGRWFPSSKLCSSCGAVKTKLPLHERVYRCDKCGLVIDRDVNAASNLAALGRRALYVAGSGPETENARGGAHPRPRSDAPVNREDGTAEADKTVTAAGQPAAA